MNKINKNYRLAVITSSDKGFKGEREDLSGPLVCKIAKEHGYEISSYVILPDELLEIQNHLSDICDNNLADLILTTGGTGFSQRDCMPEATTAVAHRLVPGIPEAMRAYSMNITKRAMLSRAVAVIRNRTLIVNLPGSPKSVEENLACIINELQHGLDILIGNDSECGQ